MITIENINLNKIIKTDEFIFISGDIKSNFIIRGNVIVSKDSSFFKKIKFLYNIFLLIFSYYAVYINDGLNKRYSLKNKKIIIQKQETFSLR
jgi:hypothetical protein